MPLRPSSGIDRMAFPTLSPAGPSLGRVRRSVAREISDWPVARVRNCRIGSRSRRCDRIGGSSVAGCCCDCCGGVGADAEECEAVLEEAAHDVSVLVLSLIFQRCRAKARLVAAGVIQRKKGAVFNAQMTWPQLMSSRRLRWRRDRAGASWHLGWWLSC